MAKRSSRSITRSSAEHRLATLTRLDRAAALATDLVRELASGQRSGGARAMAEAIVNDLAAVRRTLQMRE